MTNWRYLVQRANTRQWLHTDLPLTRTSGPTWDLSAAGSLAGTVAPDLGGALAQDGKPLLDEWSTLIYIEAGGIIRWGGIVVSSRFNGSAWSVEAAGFSAYPNGIPFGGSWALAKVDPAQIVRDLWGHVQSYPDGDLGVTVAGSTSLRIGTDSTGRLIAATASWQAAKDAYDAANKVLKTRQAAETAESKKLAPLTADKTAKNKALIAARKTGNAGQIAAAQSAYNAAVSARSAQKAVVDARKASKKAQQNVVAPLKATLDTRAEAKRVAKEAEDADGGAYKLEWWDTPDVGDEIDSLAQETPFDFTETHKWDGDDISHTITVHYPRAGRRRDDLGFTLGENVTEIADPVRDGDRFANEAIGLGAGEGAGSLRRTTAVRDGRLRRPYVLAAKDVAKATRLDALIRDERLRREQPLTIPSITVRDHSHARIGSWQLGDDILVQATLPWLGDVSIWHRIVSWELLTEHTARLSLERSDSFTYGA